MLELGQSPGPGVVGVLKGPLHNGIILPGANLVVVTETDLTGNRATGPEGKGWRRGGATPSIRWH